MPANAMVWAGVLAGFSAVVSALGPATHWRVYLLRFAVTAALLCTLIGMGAVFGKVLGDFLRGVNASQNLSPGAFAQPIWTASIEIEPPSTPSTGNVTASCC